MPHNYVSVLLPRPSAAFPTKSLRCVAQMAQAVGDQNPRFKSENILALELDMPERTTYDYEGPMMDDRVRVSILFLFPTICFLVSAAVPDARDNSRTM